MRNNNILYLFLVTGLLIGKSLLVDTYDILLIIVSFIVIALVTYYAWKKGLENLYPDIKTYLQKEFNFRNILGVFLFLIILVSPSKCVESVDEMYAGSYISECVIYDENYKNSYTWINIFSYIFFIIISMYFYPYKEKKPILVDEVKDIPRKKKKKKPRKKKSKRKKRKKRR